MTSAHSPRQPVGRQDEISRIDKLGIFSRRRLRDHPGLGDA
ncbi:hypothetical protein QF026_003836 [Streptomyces aurantiacus]|nr:hypothetical protein [Streptomyces aurantiacus]MDQ0775370.1 hypothetical protein [Streptomyces aurantiacus]